MKIPLSNPDITKSEIQSVLEVLKTPNLSLGPKVPEFEKAFAKYIGVKHAIAVCSGTAGLHLIMRSLGISDGDEVITTPFSFISSSNCILFERAKPVFVDIDPNTYNIDPQKIEEKISKKTKAILAVDVFGYPADWMKLQKIAKRHGLFLIEDSCEALGGEYKRRKLGSFGDCGCFAFYPNKQMTTGEGGIITTNNKNIADLCKSMRNQGRDESGAWLQHKRLGYNYRLSDIACALGLAQLSRINELSKKREKVASLYNKKLKNIEGIKIPAIPEDDRRSWFVYVVQLDNRYSQNDRDKILVKLRKKGIACSNYFTPIHLQPFYVDMFGCKKGDFPITEHVSERTIALPFYNNLKEDQIDYVVDNLQTIMC